MVNPCRMSNEITSIKSHIKQSIIFAYLILHVLCLKLLINFVLEFLEWSIWSTDYLLLFTSIVFMINQIYAFSAGLSSILPTGWSSEDETVQHFSYYWRRIGVHKRLIIPALKSSWVSESHSKQKMADILIFFFFLNHHNYMWILHINCKSLAVNELLLGRRIVYCKY